ncbi:MAG: hypothetical protein FWD93_01735 [Coriobacteriia bacterium]|nr:hypothetical protein [Coriobacteriia bacterium]
MSDNELDELIDASVTKHVQQKKASQAAKQQVSHKQRAQRQSQLFRFSAQGMLLCAATGKHAYDSHHAAKEAALYIQTERDTELSVYCCDICGKWHLTSH